LCLGNHRDAHTLLHNGHDVVLRNHARPRKNFQQPARFGECKDSIQLHALADAGNANPGRRSYSWKIREERNVDFGWTNGNAAAGRARGPTNSAGGGCAVSPAHPQLSTNIASEAPACTHDASSKFHLPGLALQLPDQPDTARNDRRTIAVAHRIRAPASNDVAAPAA